MVVGLLEGHNLFRQRRRQRVVIRYSSFAFIGWLVSGAFFEIDLFDRFVLVSSVNVNGWVGGGV